MAQGEQSDINLPLLEFLWVPGGQGIGATDAAGQ